MIIDDIIDCDPRIGDLLGLEINDTLIEAEITDIVDDDIVVYLDETALRMLTTQLKEIVEIDARLREKIRSKIANDQTTLDEMPYEKAVKRLTLHVFGRDKEDSEEHHDVIKKFYDDPKKRNFFEAEYQGRKVSLGKPFLTPGETKKRAVYVKNAKGNVIKVRFGDPKMRIKKSDPSRRKSFRARHNCATAKDRTTARYWSCKFW